MELKIEYIDINSIKPYENNPRHNEEAIPYVMNSIKDFIDRNFDGTLVVVELDLNALEKIEKPVMKKEIFSI